MTDEPRLRFRVSFRGAASPPDVHQCDCCKAPRKDLERSHRSTCSDAEYEKLGPTLQRFEVRNQSFHNVVGGLDLCAWCRTWIPCELESREDRQEAMHRLGAERPPHPAARRTGFEWDFAEVRNGLDLPTHEDNCDHLSCQNARSKRTALDRIHSYLLWLRVKRDHLQTTLRQALESLDNVGDGETCFVTDGGKALERAWDALKDRDDDYGGEEQ